MNSTDEETEAQRASFLPKTIHVVSGRVGI